MHDEQCIQGSLETWDISRPFFISIHFLCPLWSFNKEKKFFSVRVVHNWKCLSLDKRVGVSFCLKIETSFSSVDKTGVEMSKNVLQFLNVPIHSSVYRDFKIAHWRQQEKQKNIFFLNLKQLVDRKNRTNRNYSFGELTRSIQSHRIWTLTIFYDDDKKAHTSDGFEYARMTVCGWYLIILMRDREKSHKLINLIMQANRVICMHNRGFFGREGAFGW